MNRARIEELVSAHLDGTIEEGDAQELAAELRREGEARRYLLLAADQEAALHDLAALPGGAGTMEQRHFRTVSRRISRRTVRLVSPGGRGWRIVVAAAAAGLLAAAGWLWATQSGRGAGAELVALSGPVDVLRGDSRTAAVEKTRLLPGDRVATGEGARASVAYGDGTVIELNERTGLELLQGKAQRSLTLERGDIYVRAAAPLAINGGGYDGAFVMGTEFELSRNGESTLRVAKGAVLFGTGATATAVGMLQASRVGPGAVPSTPEPVGLAEIGAWRRAAAAGIIHEDAFGRDDLAPFWTQAIPPASVLVGGGHLVLHAGAASRGPGVRPEPAQVQLCSKPVRLGLKPVEFLITREKEDGAYRFLPVEGSPTLNADLVDETGRPVCRLTWRTSLESDGIVRGIFRVAIGQESARNVLGMPAVSRVLIDEGGRIVVVKGDSTVQVIGSLGRRASAVSLRLQLSNGGPQDVKVRWRNVQVRRLERWPEWADKLATEEELRK